MKASMIRAVFKKYWKLLLSTMLISALGSASLIALSSDYLMLETSLNDYVRNYHHPDAVITTKQTTRDRMDDLLAIPGVAEVDARLVADTVMISPSGRNLSIRAFSYDDDDFQLFHYWERSNAGEGDPILVEVNFAEDNDIKPGDSVSIKVVDEYRSYRVAGIVSSPETLAARPTDNAWTNIPGFGYVYAPRRLLEKEKNPEHEDATAKLDEKDSELSKAKEDSSQQLEDASAQLASAESELSARENEYNDALATLREQQQQLNSAFDQLSSSRDELDANQDELDRRQAELNGARQALLMQQASLVEARGAIVSQLSVVQGAIDQLVSGKDQATSKLQELEEQRDALTAAYGELEAYRSTLLQWMQQAIDASYAYDDINVPDIQAWLDEVRAQVEALTTGVPEYDEALASAKEQLIGALGNLEQELQQAVDAGNEYLQTNVAEIRAQLTEAMAQIEALTAGSPELTEALGTLEQVLQQAVDASYDYSQIDASDIQARIAEAKAQVEALTTGVPEYDEALVSTKEQLLETLGNLEQELQRVVDAGHEYSQMNASDIRARLTEAKAQIEALTAGVPQLDSAIDYAKEQLSSGFGNLEKLRDTKARLDDAIAQMDDGLRQISDGLAETETYQAQLDELQAQLTDGYAEVLAGESQLASAQDEMDAQKAEADTQLEQGRSQIAQKRTDLQSAQIQALTEFSNLEDELREARSKLSEWQGYQVFCNQFLLRFSDDAPREKTFEAAKAALGEDLVKSGYLYEDSAVKAKIDTNLKPIETMGLFVPMVFFVTTLVVVFLFMSLIVRQSRREIGIMRALGFTQASIRTLYCGTNLVVSLCSIAFGSLFGWVLSLYLNARYAAFFPLPEYTNKFDWFRFAQSGLLTILVGQLATLLSTIVVGRIQPSEAMSRPAPSTTKVPRIVEVLTSGASPLVKFSVVSMLRNKLRFAFSALCLAASVMMVFSSLSFLAAKVEIIHQLFDERVHYDYQAYMSKDPSSKLIKELNELDYVRDAEATKYFVTDVTFNGITETTSIHALPEHSTHITVFDQNDEPIEVPRSGIVLERHLADTLGASVGDTIRVGDTNMKVAVISDQHVNRFQFISLRQAKELGESSMGAVLCDVDKDREQDLVRFMSNKDGYLYSVFTNLFHTSLEKQFALTDIASWVIIGFAVVIGLVIVVNTAQTNLLEQKKELCVLRTLGFQHRSLSRHWFVQSLANYVLACIIGLPAGGYLARTALGQLTTANIEYPYASGPMEYAATALLVFAYVVISHAIAMRSFRRWDIVEGVKDKE